MCILVQFKSGCQALFPKFFHIRDHGTFNLVKFDCLRVPVLGRQLPALLLLLTADFALIDIELPGSIKVSMTFGMLGHLKLQSARVVRILAHEQIMLLPFEQQQNWRRFPGRASQAKQLSRRVGNQRGLSVLLIARVFPCLCSLRSSCLSQPLHKAICFALCHWAAAVCNCVTRGGAVSQEQQLHKWTC